MLLTKRWIVISLIIGIILSNYSFAGNIYPIDFNKQEEKTIELPLKEGVEFIPMKGILILQNIKDDGVDMKLVLADGKVWGTFPLKKSATNNVDIDRDTDDDLQVTLIDSSSGKAKISFREIREDITQANGGESGVQNAGEKLTGKVIGGNEGNKAIGIAIVIGIVIVGIGLYFFFVKKRTGDT